MIPIEWYHILPVPDIWCQLNGISFNQVQICDTNWMVSVLTNSSYVIPIEWYHNLPVPDIWYQLNSIVFTISRHVIPIEWYHILPVPDIWYQLNDISLNQFQTCDTNWIVSYHNGKAPQVWWVWWYAALLSALVRISRKKNLISWLETLPWPKSYVSH